MTTCCNQGGTPCEKCLGEMSKAFRETLRSVGIDDSPAPPEINTRAWLHQHYAQRLPRPLDTGKPLFYGTWFAVAGDGEGKLEYEGSGYFRGWPAEIPEGVRTHQTPKQNLDY